MPDFKRPAESESCARAPVAATQARAWSLIEHKVQVLLQALGDDALPREALDALQGGLLSIQDQAHFAVESCLLAARASQDEPMLAGDCLERAQALTLTLFQCGLLLVQRRQASPGWFVSARPHLDALTLALEAAWQLLRVCAYRYARVPAGVWRQVHALYQTAVSRSWQDKASAALGLSPLALYRRILLLGLTATNSLEPVKLDLLFTLLREEAMRLRLCPLPAVLPAPGAFIVRPHSDTAPRFCAADAALAEAGYLLDLQAVVAALRTRLHQQSGPGLVQQTQLWLRLRYEWEGSARRRHLRHQRLQDRQLNLLGRFDVCWDVLNGGRFVLPGRAQRHGQWCQLQLLDISQSGVLVQGTAALQAGDVVLLGQRPGALRCALVRRVSREGERCQFGIEYLGKKAAAVLVRVENSLGGQDEWQPALSLHGDVYRGQGNMLLLEGRPFQAMRTFSLTDAAGRKTIQATRLRSQTTRYQLFGYKIVAIEA